MKRDLLPRILLYMAILACIAIVFVIGPEHFLNILIAADYRFILLAVLSYGIILLAGFLRWMFFLDAARCELKPKKVAGVYFYNCFISNLTPARSGDVIAPLLLKKYSGVEMMKGVVLIGAERLLDFLVLLVFFALSGFWLYSVYGAPAYLSAFESIFYTVVLVVAILLALTALLRSHVFRSKIEVFFELKRLQFKMEKRIIIAGMLGFSVITWFLHFMKEYFLFNAFMSIGYLQVVICVSISNVAGLLSFIPGGLGVNVVTSAAVVKQMGLSWQSAAASVLVGTVLFTVIRMVFGILFSRTMLASSSLGEISQQ